VHLATRKFLRTTLTLATGALLAGALISPATAPAGTASRGHGSPPVQWVGTWATGPTEVPDGSARALEDQTVRQVVHLSTGGDELRLRLTNEFGEVALHLGEVRVAVRRSATGTDIDPATDTPVTFAGAKAVTIPAGAPALSDPVELEVEDDSDLVVSIYVPDAEATSLHNFPYQVNAIADGNVTAAESVTPVDEPQQ